MPAPACRDNYVVVRSRASLISAGTEQSIIAAGRQTLIDRAYRQPRKVLDLLNRAYDQGIASTYQATRTTLDRLQPLGYCNAGVVVEVGSSVVGFRPGMRVASNGPHAEIVVVPANLCAAVPSGVDDATAAMTVQGAIALHGVRLGEPTLGETFVVSGLGLVGLLAVQVLRAQGCTVIGLDVRADRLAVARSFGATPVDLASEDAEAVVLSVTSGRGADAVIVAAAASDPGPLAQAASLCRKRGRIVLIGVAEIAFERSVLYEKEISFCVSRSYGPGRYDPAYEEAGYDYPYAYVRWTAQRNFEAILALAADGKFDATSLITRRVSLEQADTAYQSIEGSAAPLGILFEYPSESVEKSRTSVVVVAPRAPLSASTQDVRLGLIGAGAYASNVLLPALEEKGVTFEMIANRSGLSALNVARRRKFRATTTDPEAIFSDSAINTVVITTRHDSHAALTISALKAGKHVFIEKPLCLSREELAAIQKVYADRCNNGTPLVLMVGFNRRYAPLIEAMKVQLDLISEPKVVTITVNAGNLPPEHWTRDPSVGGGRILGEACHHVDLLMHLMNTPVETVKGLRVRSPAARTVDSATILFGFGDGSIGSIQYLENGHPGVSKERVEVFASGRILQLDDFARLRAFGWPSLAASRRQRQDKGNRACIGAFIDAVRSGIWSPTVAESSFRSMETTFDAVDALA